MLLHHRGVFFQGDFVGLRVRHEQMGWEGRASIRIAFVAGIASYQSAPAGSKVDLKVTHGGVRAPFGDAVFSG